MGSPFSEMDYTSLLKWTGAITDKLTMLGSTAITATIVATLIGHLSIDHKVPHCIAPTLSSSNPNDAQFFTACKCSVVRGYDCAWLWYCVTEQVLRLVVSIQNGQPDTGNSSRPPAATEGPGRKEHGSRDYRTEGSCPCEYALTV